MSLLQSVPVFFLAIILFFIIIGSYLFGHRVRRKLLHNDPEHSKDLGAINGTLLGLLGLLLAFTFGMSNSRFDSRRSLVIEEANNIGTVILRTDFYPDSVRNVLRNKLKAYVEARIAFYEASTDIEKTLAYYDKADKIGKEIWSTVATYAKTDDVTTRTSMLIPALNDMIDITTTRRAASEAKIPGSIMGFLLILCFCSAFLLGYDNKHNIDWVVVTGFAFMLSATVFNIIDLDRPRSGLINLDLSNEKMIELRDLFEGN